MKIPGHKEIWHSPQYWENRLMCLRMRRKQAKSPENITGMSETHLTEVTRKNYGVHWLLGEWCQFQEVRVSALVHKEQTRPKLNWRRETQHKTMRPILPGWAEEARVQKQADLAWSYERLYHLLTGRRKRTAKDEDDTWKEMWVWIKESSKRGKSPGSEKDLKRKVRKRKMKIRWKSKAPPPPVYTILQQYRDRGRNTQQLSSRRCNKHW